MVSAETSNEAWFSIKIPYSYWTTSNGSIELSGPPFPINHTIDEDRLVSSQHMIYLNLTLITDISNESCDARVEYYQIEVRSDKELIETMHWDVGTNSNSSFSLENTFDKPPFNNNWFFLTSLN